MRASFLFLLIIFSNFLQAQNSYDLGIESLDKADMPTARSYFKQGLNSSELKEKCLLALFLLEEVEGNEYISAGYGHQYLSLAKDPQPFVMSSFGSEMFFGTKGLKKSYHKDNLNYVESNIDRFRDLESALYYQQGLSYSYSRDRKKALEYFNRIKGISNWQILGPFANKMNSGYNKDYGVLEKPEPDAVFESEDRAKIQWFTPINSQEASYFVKENHIRQENSLVYAQSFVNSPLNQEVIFRFSYSGSFKLWVNDQVAYSQTDERNTPMDFYAVKTTLSKGYNRILIQLGDHRIKYPTFNIKVCNTDGENLGLEGEAIYHPYYRGKQEFLLIENLTFQKLSKDAQNGDLICKLLHFRNLTRMLFSNEAETLAKDLLEAHGDNLLVLKFAIDFYSQEGNETEKGRLESHFEKMYPESYIVLVKEMSDAFSKSDKQRFLKHYETFKQSHENKEVIKAFTLFELLLDKNLDGAFSFVKKLAEDYPEEPKMATGLYDFLTSVKGDKKGGIKVLYDFHSNLLDYEVVNKLAAAYRENGDYKKAIDLYNDMINHDLGPLYARNRIASLYSKQGEYEKAVSELNYVLLNKPTDYDTYYDIANLYKFSGQKNKALKFYEEALKHFPFSFSINEEIRDLKGLKPTKDLVEKIDPEKVIADFNSNYKTDKKSSVNYVVIAKNAFLFKSLATGWNFQVIMKINDEKGIEEYQHLNFSPGANNTSVIHEAKIIKPDGQVIEGDKEGYEVVFQNLEIGDYVYYDYTETQTSGGVTSRFIFENFGFSSYVPTFIYKYRLFAETGLHVNDSLFNHLSEPVIGDGDGFVTYDWNISEVDILESESNAPHYYDLAQSLQYSTTDTWQEVAEWYRDLTEEQIKPDPTIQNIVKGLFPLGLDNYSTEQKAKTIYDFVCGNIQYSSIDFRQSNIVPQKASKIYYDRLGDCKDVSTLYVSLANVAGVDSRLVLINTSNNGKNSTNLPSTNFNHCIVKVNLDKTSHYLELTDSYLPYGYLYPYHEGSAILDIPRSEGEKTQSLSRLHFNEGFKNEVHVSSDITIKKDGQIVLKNSELLKGTPASDFTYDYLNEDGKEQKERLQNRLGSYFKSEIDIVKFDFEKLEKLKDSTAFSYQVGLRNDITKVGSFKMFKLPFINTLMESSIFQSDERKYEFDFFKYESIDLYTHQLSIEFEDGISLVEIPENQRLEFKGSVYTLSFKKVSDTEIQVNRMYKPARQNFSAEKFDEFAAFAEKIIEAENTNLMFK